ncbi:response regulator receiver [Actinoplanes sp. SE50]|uniref:response regulator n=1 Tax=unclassified Actinoplanes TaxID=2626549 RepID=UPI00023ED028|nr:MULTISPECIES: response regulator [unclassified Actinoplanes]AEV83294.1 putative transcriptional regulator ycf27 [Actinoplanes sp. SE50/110]ATO81687.1 response regulator receiver [Actinoplanes sp. SE50]SLL99095.1 response regulator receiver domain protein [Actinoplanes sp. SE50/110]
MPHTSTTALTFSDAEAGLTWPMGDWAAALEPPTVLIADDDEGIRDLVGTKLRAAGYRTLIAADGRTAMALAVGERPSLVLLDVCMPGLDGLGFCYELHSSPETAHIPVIFISGRAEPDDIALGRVVGAEDYLVKPIDPADLLERVQRLLGH